MEPRIFTANDVIILFCTKWTAIILQKLFFLIISGHREETECLPVFANTILIHGTQLSAGPGGRAV